MAIDYVGGYPGRFDDLPQHRGINLAIQLDQLERRFGGCAMNIAYTLALLGESPAPFVYVGGDFENAYAAHLSSAGVDRSGIHVVDAPYSAHAFVFTDRDGNQFTGFFGGPGPDERFGAELRTFATGADYAIVAPDLPGNMIAAARAITEAGVDFLTDPGQNLTDFGPDEAVELMRLSKSVVVNEYEHATLTDLAGAELDALDLVMVTEGERGIRWRSKSEGNGNVPAVASAGGRPHGLRRCVPRGIRPCPPVRRRTSRGGPSGSGHGRHRAGNAGHPGSRGGGLRTALPAGLGGWSGLGSLMRKARAADVFGIRANMAPC